jgi:hypothetical protein
MLKQELDKFLSSSSSHTREVVACCLTTQMSGHAIRRRSEVCLYATSDETAGSEVASDPLVVGMCFWLFSPGAARIAVYIFLTQDSRVAGH